MSLSFSAKNFLSLSTSLEYSCTNLSYSWIIVYLLWSFSYYRHFYVYFLVALLICSWSESSYMFYEDNPSLCCGEIPLLVGYPSLVINLPLFPNDSSTLFSNDCLYTLSSASICWMCPLADYKSWTRDSLLIYKFYVPIKRYKKSFHRFLLISSAKQRKWYLLNFLGELV